MSRDVKGTSVTEINDGLEKAIRRCKNQLTEAIAEAETNAIRFAASTANDAIKRSQQATNERIDSISRNLSSRIETMQRNLGARIDMESKRLTEDILTLDRRHTRAVRELSDSMHAEMEAQHKLIVSEVSRLDKNIGILNAGIRTVTQGLNDLSRQTSERFTAQQKEISSIHNDVKALFDRQTADVNGRLLAAGAALALLDAIRERTDVKKFAPAHMLESIALKEERLRNIYTNPDACTITDANILIDEALVMENEAIRRRNEWEPIHNATLTAAIAVLNLLEKSKTIKVSSLYDESDEELQADYWTHGEYSRTLNEIQALKTQIENASADISHLKELQAQTERLRHKAEELIIEAAELGTLSEQRVIVSNDVLNAMINQGWELKGDPDFMGGEEDSDWREGTFAVLHKPNTGEELSILVLPEEKNGKKGNQIIFHRNDERLESAGAFQSRMEEIKREIEKSGYRLSSLREPEHGDGKIDLLRHRETMSRRGASEKLKSTLRGRQR